MANKYGEGALIAVSRNLSSSPDPGTHWEQAMKAVYPSKPISQKKHCPKSAFLGLCEEGFVQGFPRGIYTSSKLNKNYAVRAVNLLQSGSTPKSPMELWREVMNGEKKSHNSQMNVVLALWDNGWISRS
jgi:hypothetical protein